jgi:hypothetical protein
MAKNPVAEAKATDQGHFPLGEFLALDLFIFTVGMTFSTVYPILLPFVLAYFVMTYTIGKVSLECFMASIGLFFSSLSNNDKKPT